MISDLFRTGKTSFIFHLKIPKPGEDRLSLAVAHVGDERSTSSCPATTALPCQDSPILLGRFSSLSLGEATRPGDCLSLALDQGDYCYFIKFMFYTCPVFYAKMLIFEIL